MPKPDVSHASARFSISDLAREFDLTTRAIRFYEDCGLLAPERGGAGGRQRLYTARDRTRLRLTLRGKRLGLSLAEIKELVDMYESPRDSAPQLRKYLAVLAAHRGQVEQQMSDLQATLDEVRAHEKEARKMLAVGEAKAAARGARAR
jgi:DNA-binding transcriptional MerR regulator